MYETVEKLMKARGISAYRLAKETGLSTSMLSNWKAGRYSPKADKLKKIADYFHVPVSLIIDGPISEGVEDLFVGKDKDEREPQYYIDPQTAEIAQEMYDRPELKVLMDASRKLSADDIKAVQAMVEHLWKVQHPDE